MCKHLGPVRVRRSKYSLLLLYKFYYACWCTHTEAQKKGIHETKHVTLIIFAYYSIIWSPSPWLSFLQHFTIKLSFIKICESDNSCDRLDVKHFVQSKTRVRIKISHEHIIHKSSKQKKINKHHTDHFQKKNIFCEGANQSTESIDDNDEANKNKESHR